MYAFRRPGDGAMGGDVGMPAMASNARPATGRYGGRRVVPDDSPPREDLACGAKLKRRLACPGFRRPDLKVAENGSFRPSHARPDSSKRPGYEDPIPGTADGAGAGTNAPGAGGMPSPAGQPQSNCNDGGVPACGAVILSAGAQTAGLRDLGRTGDMPAPKRGTAPLAGRLRRNA